MSSKYVIVLGSSFSGIGKGILSASIAMLLKARSFDVSYVKIDPYLNIGGSGSISPVEHGENFVLSKYELDDCEDCDYGVETDLDLGHIERIASITLNKDSAITAGSLYKELIEDQEKGKYLGKTITNNPFITDKIINKIEKIGNDNSVLIVEIGGTVDDAESAVFIDALRQFKQKHKNDCLFILVSPIIWLETIKEWKTKILQRGVKDLQSYGIIPDVLLCRASKEVPNGILDKISQCTGIPRDSVLVGADVETIYEVPMQMYKQELDDIIVDKLSLKRNYCKIKKYKECLERIKNITNEINIGLVVKYGNYSESYLSVKEALFHAGVVNDTIVNIKWITAEDLEDANEMKCFSDIDGIVIPGGFGERGTEGKINAIKYARENKIPCFGICLGLQLMAIEISRNLCKLQNSTSEEFNKDAENKIVHFVDGQENAIKKGGNMRLGTYNCKLTKNTLAYSLYGKEVISEKHRHRYELNEKYVSLLEQNEFIVSGRNPKSNLVEIMELKNHPFFLGVQFHGEFKSRFNWDGNLGHPVFIGFVSKVIENKKLNDK